MAANAFFNTWSPAELMTQDTSRRLDESSTLRSPSSATLNKSPSGRMASFSRGSSRNMSRGDSGRLSVTSGDEDLGQPPAMPEIDWKIKLDLK